jgi:iron complex transport system substrate-binding protein
LIAPVLLVGSACVQIEAPPLRHREYVQLDAPPLANLTRACDARDHRGWDYFPAKTRFEHSTQLDVSYHGAYKVVTFRPVVHKGLVLRYVLYQCGTSPPSGYDDATLVEVPAQRAVLNNPAFGGTIDRLGVIDRFYGVNGFEEYTNAAIVQAGRDGRLHEFGTRGVSTIERAVALDPDIVFLFYSASPNFNLHPALARIGVRAVVLGDIFEETALGRAEWVKFMSLFFNEEARANAIVDAAAGRYRDLAARVETTTARPVVFQGFPANRDTWTAVGGRNHVASTIRDAGGRYFLADDRSSNLNVHMPFERAIEGSFDARVWIGMNGVNRVKRSSDLVRNAPQVAELGPIRTGGAVYAMDRHMNTARFFPYGNESLDKPDVVLADFVSVLHPELLPGYQPMFIRRLE